MDPADVIAADNRRYFPTKESRGREHQRDAQLSRERTQDRFAEAQQHVGASRREQLRHGPYSANA